jgi:MSHA biogenesis protein MshP
MKTLSGKLQYKERGLSLATALFVITVMAVLAALIFQLVRNNAETTQEEILLIRSFYAAETGVQFGLNRVFPPNGAATTCATTTTYPQYAFSEGGLEACTADVTCAPLVVNTATYYTITSKGTCGAVSRTVQVRAR